MPPAIRAVVLTPKNHSEVEHFHCGDAPYQVELTEWITGTECLNDMRDRNTQAWLFYAESGGLVGFGSLGTTEWCLPNPNSPKKQICIVPMFALDSAFHGKPEGCNKVDRYSWSVLSFLVSRARQSGLELLGLFVHKDNAAAKSLYDFGGFKPLSGKPNKWGNSRMVLDLTVDI